MDARHGWHPGVPGKLGRRRRSFVEPLNSRKFSPSAVSVPPELLGCPGVRRAPSAAHPRSLEPRGIPSQALERRGLAPGGVVAGQLGCLDDAIRAQTGAAPAGTNRLPSRVADRRRTSRHRHRPDRQRRGGQPLPAATRTAARRRPSWNTARRTRRVPDRNSVTPLATLRSGWAGRRRSVSSGGPRTSGPGP